MKVIIRTRFTSLATIVIAQTPAIQVIKSIIPIMSKKYMIIDLVTEALFLFLTKSLIVIKIPRII
jgi:hypothetical protein